MANSDQPYLGPNPERGMVGASVPLSSALVQRPTETNAHEFLATARKRFLLTSQVEAKLREKMRDDQRFRDADQWPANVRAERESDQRPCLTVNRLPVFIRQVTNQQRQSKPAIQINPVDSGSDPETAEVLQGIIRHIEVQSQADVAYDTACDHQVTMGRGFVRIVVEWSEINPWEQEIRIKRIRNPFTVYFDPACQEVDYRDARFAFVVEDIPRDAFVARYGAAAATNSMIFQSIGDRSGDWYPEGKIRVAEYFYVDVTTEKVSLLSNGEQMTSAQLADPDVRQFMNDTGVTITRSRTIEKRTVKWAKITGSAILEQADWPGRWIPIVPVLGDEIDLNGELDLKGMVRDAKDPQRMYNYWNSAQTEMIALSPRAPFIGYEGQFEGHEDQWKLANRRNFPYLQTKPMTIGGQPAPHPQRNAVEPPIAALVAAIRQSDNDLKAVTGFYDASLGEQGPESSGRAILARQKQGDIANINWLDNLGRAIRAVGRICLDLIPKIYDTPRVMRILGLDEQPMMVKVGTKEALPNDKPTEDELQQGIHGIYALDVGRYDVTVSVGPSYQSRRQEAVEAMTSFIQAFPAAAPMIGDVLAESMDWPGATVIAGRLKKMLPPQLQDKEPGAEEIPAEAQQQISQMGQMLDQFKQAMTEMQKVIDGKQIEAQSREKIAMINAQKDMAIAALESKTDAAVALAGQQMTQFAATLAADSERQKQEAEHAHGRLIKGAELDHQRTLKGAELADTARTHAVDTRVNLVKHAVDTGVKREQIQAAKVAKSKAATKKP